MQQQLHGNDRLSWGDALFLYLEREGMPLHVAGLNLFEGIISLDQCSDYVLSKLPLIPRYRQRVVMPPFNLGLPAWELDPYFDIRNHIRAVTLKRGTDAEIKRISAALLSKVMDRHRPLWDLTLMHDHRHNRTAVLARVHHSMVDGTAGVALVSTIMDSNPAPPRLPRKKPQFAAAPPPRDTFTTLLDALLTTPFYVVERLVSAQSELLNIVERVLGGATFPAEELVGLLPELLSATQRLPFNVICNGPQKFAFTQVSLAEIKAIKDACAVTVNDVILAVFIAAVRRYAELHGVKMKGRRLRVVVPVNVRKPGMDELGNRISFLPLTLPLGIRDPRKLLAAVHERMNVLKRSHAAEFVGLAGTVMGMAPIVLQAVAAPVASAAPLSICNTICTNVPGPQMPLYLIGHKMLSWYPYVPIGGEMGMNCAVLTYNGVAHFGFTGDVHAIPDLERMEALLSESFVELRKAAGVKPARPQRMAKPKPAVAKPKPAAKPPKLRIVAAAAGAQPAQVEPATATEPPKVLVARTGT